MASPLLLMFLAAGLYHLVFIKGAREAWPVVGALIKRVVKDVGEQRDRFMRGNIDVLARQLGEMPAKLTQLESPGERISGLAGINPGELCAQPGRGGEFVGARSLTMNEVQAALADIDRLTAYRVDLMTVMASRFFEEKMEKMMLPTQEPVP